MQKLIIIGGGAAGYSAAIRARQLNFQVVLIEKENLGGTCLNRGCIPTKTLLHSSDLFYQIRNSAEIELENLNFNMQKMFEKKDKIVSKLNSGIKSLVNANQIEHHNSLAKLKSSNSVELDDKSIIEGDKIILATGAKPSTIPIEGIELALTSDDFLEKKFDKYQNIVIIGGGVIGIELACFFSDLGCNVTVIEALDSILSVMGKDISKYITMILRKKSVKFATKSSVKKIVKTEDGFETFYEQRQNENSVISDIVINATGRSPLSIEGIENTGVIFDKGFVVDENNRTPDENIYAIGDCVKGNVQLAHYAAAEGMRIVEKLANKIVSPLKNVPSCIYTSPNAAIIGKSQAECSFEIEVGRFNVASSGKSLSQGGQNGFIKVVFDKESQRIVGAEMVSGAASELAGFISNLINIGATRKDILSTVYPHPSYSEGFIEACQDSINCSIHTIYKK
ncbi:MAG: dihydrolipoyl dehydrogenase [Bacillota bacterium]